MGHMETGLRHRLRRCRRQIEKQHQQLHALHLELGEALAVGDADAARSLVERMLAAIDAHFAMEEGMLFPALHGLDPKSGRDVEAFAAQHARHRERLTDLQGDIAGELVASLAPAYREFAASMFEHEQHEEAWIADLMARGGG
jgi:hemerythrin